MRATVHTRIEVQVRPITGDDLAHVQQALPPEHPEAHARRLADQRAGRSAYLIGWSRDQALGHAIVRWGGTTNPELRWLLASQTPEPYIEALFVHPSFRSRSVGSQILAAVEALARERGSVRLGLAVAVDNPRARALYERLGYQDTGIGHFESAWTYVDHDGNDVAESETCSYLVKVLAAPADQPPSRKRRR